MKTLFKTSKRSHLPKYQMIENISAYLRARASPAQVPEIQKAMLQLVNIHGTYVTSLPQPK